MDRGRRAGVAGIAIALGVLSVVVFLPGLAGEFVWDDHELIAGNSFVREPSLLGEALSHDFWHTSSSVDRAGQGQGHNFYRPVVTLAYFVQFQLFGEHPLGYHVVSLALHVACVLLAFVWLRRRLGGGATATIAAGVAAALFAVHPTRVESVSWISGSTDLWLALFVLLGLSAWDRWRGALGTILASVAFLLATLCKENGAVAPLLLLLDAVLCSASREERRAGCRRAVAPLLVVAAATALHFALVPPAVGGAGQGPWDTVQRIASSLGLYVGRIVWPWPPSVQVGWQRVDASGTVVYIGWSVVVGLFAAAALLGLAWRAWKRPGWRPLLRDACWFLLPLLPLLNLVSLNMVTLVSTRYLYLPLLGLLPAVARAVRRVATAERPMRVAGLAAAGLVVVAGGAVALGQQGELRNDEALWTYEHGLAPDNPSAAKVLAGLRLDQGRYDEALDLVAHVYRLRPGDPFVRAELVLMGASCVLGAASDADQPRLLAVRRFFDNVAEGRPARLTAADLELELGANPAVRRYVRGDLENFQVPRAVAHARTLDLAGAERLLRTAVGEAPGSVAAWANLALVLAREERWDEAEGAVGRGLRAKPDDEFLASLLEPIASARARAATVARGDPVVRELTGAETAIAFGGLELARRRLEPLIAARPDDPRPVLLRLRADVIDRRFDLARGVLTTARRRDPGHATLWDELWEKLALEEVKQAAAAVSAR